MKKWRNFLFILLIIAISATLHLVASNVNAENELAEAETATSIQTIAPGDDLQQAIDSLPEGGKLTLKEGEYNTLEAVVLENRKNLTIEGKGTVWINTKGIDHHVITLKNCENITLLNIKAQHVILEEGDNDPIEDGRDGAVVGVLEGKEIRLNSCELVGCGIYGVYSHAAELLVLEDCYVHDNAKSGVLLTTDSRQARVAISGCTIKDNVESIETRGDIYVMIGPGNNIESGPYKTDKTMSGPSPTPESGLKRLP
jgi:hypothetical protein